MTAGLRLGDSLIFDHKEKRVMEDDSERGPAHLSQWIIADLVYRSLTGCCEVDLCVIERCDLSS